jgi:hypothetical protein
LNPPSQAAATLAMSPNPTVCRPRFNRGICRRDTKALLRIENAAALIETLPASGHEMHAICNGNFAAWDLVPAILKMTGSKVVRLDVATLGFSKQNVMAIRRLLDDGRIGELWMVYSCYFRSTSNAETELLHDTLNGPHEHLAAFRNHAKILLLEMASGDSYTVETSANLRSCKNIEQYVITNDEPLLRFHRDWIEGAIREVAANGEKK